MSELTGRFRTGPTAVIVELGANDALARGRSRSDSRQALDAYPDAAEAARKIAVLLAGMYAPRNLGLDYIAAFDSLYRGLSNT